MTRKEFLTNLDKQVGFIYSITICPDKDEKKQIRLQLIKQFNEDAKG